MRSESDPWGIESFALAVLRHDSKGRDPSLSVFDRGKAVPHRFHGAPKRGRFELVAPVVSHVRGDRGHVLNIGGYQAPSEPPRTVDGCC